MAMLFIVAHHFAVHGKYGGGISTLNQGIIDTLIIGGKLGVNVFVLISGYFMVNSTFKLKKAISLFIQVSFYSVIIYCVLCICKVVPFTFGELIASVFSITTNQYWFMLAYFVLYILSPYINKLIKACNQKEHLILILILFVFQASVKNLLVSSLSNVGWFIMLYLIASYIHLYPNKITDNNKIALPVFIISLLTIIAASVFFKTSLYGMKNIVLVICSLSMFCTFKNIKMENIKAINIISSATLGVYLIHDNRLMRALLWPKLLNTPLHATFDTFIIFAIVSVIGVFVLCTLIELLRQLLFKLVGKLAVKIKEVKKENQAQ